MTRAGELVGLNTWIAKGQNLGFAVHVDHLIDLLKQDHSTTSPLPLPDTNVISDAGVARIIADFQKEYRVLIENLQVAPNRRRGSRSSSGRIRSRSTLVAWRSTRRPIPGHSPSLRRYGRPARSCAAIRSRSATNSSSSPTVCARTTWRTRGWRASWRHWLSPPTDAVKNLLRQFIVKGANPQVRGTACYSLAMAQMGSTPGETMASADAIETLDRAVREFGDVTVADRKLSEVLPPLLFKCQHLSVNGRGAGDRRN